MSRVPCALSRKQEKTKAKTHRAPCAVGKTKSKSVRELIVEKEKTKNRNGWLKKVKVLSKRIKWN
jgi:hypothetical protein